MTTETTSVRVVPKADVDRLFTEIYQLLGLPRNHPLAHQLRGIAYANSFMTDRTIIREE